MERLTAISAVVDETGRADFKKQLNGLSEHSESYIIVGIHQYSKCTNTIFKHFSVTVNGSDFKGKFYPALFPEQDSPNFTFCKPIDWMVVRSNMSNDTFLQLHGDFKITKPINVTLYLFKITGK